MTLSGLLIGGAIPAVCLGLGTVFMRASIGAGASIPLYLAVVGSVVALLGWVAFICGDGDDLDTGNCLYGLWDRRAETAGFDHRTIDQQQCSDRCPCRRRGIF